jgi:glycosyltransferase involved in cell wall biosynthesis
VIKADDWRTRLSLAPDQLHVLKIANITRFRDHATLLRAWKIVQDGWQHEPKPVLTLAGALGDSIREVQRIWREARLGSTVRFIGLVQDISSLVGACDLAVFSSCKEGMPNGVLECMAGGKAVVATDLPGIRDALGPDADEQVVPPGNPEALAARIQALLVDPGRRTSLGDANRRRALSEFTVARMTGAYLDILERQSQSLRATKTRRPVQTADESRSYSA